MTRVLKAAIIALLLIHCQHVKSQCPSTPQVLDKILIIQNKADISVPEKIRQLHQLQQLFYKCYKTKDSVYARIMHRLGDMYSKANNLEKAIYYTKEAVVVNTASNVKAEKSFLANSYFNLGLFYKGLNLSNESLNCFDSCIIISTQYPVKYPIAFMAYEEKAVCFFQRGDYQKSLETADNGILFAKKNNDTINEASPLSQKAQAQIELNEINEAERNILRSIFILETKSTDTTLLAASYSIYANLLGKKGDTKRSIRYYCKSFDLNKAKGNWLQCSRNMLNLGALYDANLQNNVKAIACYKQGIKILEKANDAYQLAALYINMGAVNWHKKNYTLALNFYQKALNVLPFQFSDTSIKSNPSVNMLKLVSSDYYISTLLSNKGEALLDQYKVKKNIELLQAALSTFLVADKSVDLMRWKQSGEQSKLFWRGKTKEMYGNAIEVCYLLNNVEKAFYFFEKSRAVLLNDKLSELGAKKFLSPSDNIKEQQLRIKVSSLNQQLSSLSDTAVSYNTTKQLLLTSQEEWEKFIKSLEKKYPVYFQYKYENTIYPIRTIKDKLLFNNQSLIEFFTGDSAIYVLHVSHAKEQLLKIDFKDFSGTTKSLMALCSNTSIRLNKNYSRYRTLAYQLYEKIYKPLDVSPGRVIISPDDYFIPFEALLSDKNDPSSFLLKKYAFSYTYSMGLLMKKGNANSFSGSSFLGVAPVNYRPYLHLNPLEGADQSLKKIEPYFTDVSFLIKEDATKQQFLKQISLYQTVQIYSHADADSSDKNPVLYLSDSAININEIQTLQDFQTDMIILSACKTGIGKNARGEGIFSLARAFMSVGIPSTVTTLWQVDNQATYQLTETFYKYLSLGLPKDVALQKAKLEFIANKDETYELPFFWASSIVLGKTDIIAKNKENKRHIVIITIACLLPILVSAYLVKKYLKKRSGSTIE